MQTKLKLSTPSGLNVALVGLLCLGLPSLNGSGVRLFGWGHWPEAFTVALVLVGLLMSFLGLVIILRGSRAAKPRPLGDVDPTPPSP